MTHEHGTLAAGTTLVAGLSEIGRGERPPFAVIAAQRGRGSPGIGLTVPLALAFASFPDWDATTAATDAPRAHGHVNRPWSPRLPRYSN